MTRVAVIYYSASGNVHALAQAMADGAEEVGADQAGRLWQEGNSTRQSVRHVLHLGPSVRRGFS